MLSVSHATTIREHKTKEKFVAMTIVQANNLFKWMVNVVVVGHTNELQVTKRDVNKQPVSTNKFSNKMELVKNVKMIKLYPMTVKSAFSPVKTTKYLSSMIYVNSADKMRCQAWIKRNVYKSVKSIKYFQLIQVLARIALNTLDLRIIMKLQR